MTLKTAPRAKVAPPARSRLRDFGPVERFQFDRVVCRDCGGGFPAPEGSALLYALKGRCPNCGGDYVFVLGGAG